MPSPEEDVRIRSQLTRWAKQRACPDCGTVGLVVEFGLGIKPRLHCTACQWEATTRPG